MKIGILKESKVPPDKRVPLTPRQCKTLLNIYPRLQIAVEASDVRCFTDAEYEKEGVEVTDDIRSCDFFMGIKEVDKLRLYDGKSYLFFSHTIKGQLHNRMLLKAILDKHIRLIDYELLADRKGARIIGFGRYAGIVGGYNALLTYGMKYGLYRLKPAYQCRDRAELFKELAKVKLPAIKCALTGSGRVAGGVLEVFEAVGLLRVTVQQFLTPSFPGPCFVQLGPGEYVKHKRGLDFDLMHFYRHPENYEGNFQRFCPHADMLVSAAYWDPRSPVLFSLSDIRSNDFNIRLIADISCDIGGAVPTTVRAASITSPHYDFSVSDLREMPAFSDPGNITVMAVDNLPCELPVDASREFGSHLINRVMDFIIKADREGMIERATIAENGQLKDRFAYLQSFVKGNEITG